MRRFIILCHGRSGSELLVRALQLHPDVCMFGELLSHNEEDRRRYFAVDGRVFGGSDEDGASFLREVVFREREQRAVGFKLLHFQANEGAAATAWSWLIADRALQVIHLHRDDLLAYLVSAQTALRTKQWHVQPGETPVAAEPFRLEVEHCQRVFKSFSAGIQRAHEQFAGHHSLDLEYARDLVGDFHGTMARIWHFLELPPLDVQPPLAKQARLTPRQQISNHDELAAHFAGTSYARFFTGRS